jgi:hypothetical protein
VLNNRLRLPPGYLTLGRASNGRAISKGYLGQRKIILDIYVCRECGCTMKVGKFSKSSDDCLTRLQFYSSGCLIRKVFLDREGYDGGDSPHLSPPPGGRGSDPFVTGLPRDAQQCELLYRH